MTGIHNSVSSVQINAKLVLPTFTAYLVTYQLNLELLTVLPIDAYALKAIMSRLLISCAIFAITHACLALMQLIVLPVRLEGSLIHLGHAHVTMGHFKIAVPCNANYAHIPATTVY
jgi:hypothetical protein